MRVNDKNPVLLYYGVDGLSILQVHPSPVMDSQAIAWNTRFKLE